jgi:NDP-sugar pyrophosphorylase family protein
MKVVIPMSGMSSRFAAAGYDIPKYLIEVDGKKVIEHIVNLYPEDSDFVFIINEKHKEEINIVGVLDKLVGKKEIITIPCHKKGPVYSVSEFDHLIDDDEEVIVNYCDFSIYWDYRHFREYLNTVECDGCVICYTGFHPHMLGSDNYAFCRTDDSVPDEKILEVREKQPFTDDKMSEFASAGNYYFRKGSYVKKYFKQLMDEDININGEYYVSLIYNLMVRDGLYNTVYEIPYMLQWGTPFDLDVYNSWSNYYRKALEWQKEVRLENCTLALPMAGAGSRFSKEGYTEPKPFIQVNDKNMVEQAVRCLPKTDEIIYACLKGHQAPGENVVWIDEVLEGQACTTEKIVDQCDPENSILVSACDNGVFYDADKFLDLANDESNDIIVWTYRNNYTSHLQPNAYSWVNCDSDGNVSRVDVKKFTGTDPVKEFAITGTMFFRSREVFFHSLKSLYENDVRTNGEFYVDSMLNEAISLGYKVKNFEIDNYICWGTPNDLKTYEYWQRFFNKVEWHPYEYSKDYFTN